MASAWFSVEYFWCSVDIRTYCAALIGSENFGRAPVGRNSSCDMGRPRPARCPSQDWEHQPRTAVLALREAMRRRLGMSPTEKDRKFRSISGITFPASGVAEAIARALHREFDDSRSAVKTVVSLTGANPRA